MNDDVRRLLAELARIAAESGPALMPAGHDELLRSITEAARGVFSAAACSLALLSDDESELVFHVASGTGADEVVGLRVPVDRGIAGWVVTSGQPIAIEDVAADPRFASDVADETGYRPTSILAMPLQTDRRMIGAIEVLDRSADRDGSRDMQVLGLFADQAALAIENSRVFEDLGRVLLEALGRIVDDDDLHAALTEVAAGSTGPSRELAEIAGAFRALGEAGPSERRLAASVLHNFLSYARTRRWQS